VAPRNAYFGVGQLFDALLIYYSRILGLHSRKILHSAIFFYMDIEKNRTHAVDPMTPMSTSFCTL